MCLRIALSRNIGGYIYRNKIGRWRYRLEDTDTVIELEDTDTDCKLQIQKCTDRNTG